MILNHWLAESGSTKTDWVCYSGPLEGTHFLSEGLNPSYLPAGLLEQELLGRINGHSISPEEVGILHWYGAGTESLAAKEALANALQTVFATARISVRHDLLAAARGLLGVSGGLVGILGTGSHVCAYTGTEIGEQAINLGYILGDEGGGTDMGRRLLKAYFYHQLPKEEEDYVESELLLTRDEVIDKLYRLPAPNRWLASLAQIIGKSPFLRVQIAQPALLSFIETHVLPLSASIGETKLAAVGSIAAYFEPELKEMCAGKLELIKVEASPLSGLIAYHKEAGFTS